MRRFRTAGSSAGKPDLASGGTPSRVAAHRHQSFAQKVSHAAAPHRHAIEVRAARCRGGRCVGHFVGARGHEVEWTRAGSPSSAHDDPEDFGVQALTDFGAAVIDLRRAVEIKMNERTGLVVVCLVVKLMPNLTGIVARPFLRIAFLALKAPCGSRQVALPVLRQVNRSPRLAPVLDTAAEAVEPVQPDAERRPVPGVRAAPGRRARSCGTAALNNWIVSSLRAVRDGAAVAGVGGPRRPVRRGAAVVEAHAQRTGPRSPVDAPASTRPTTPGCAGSCPGRSRRGPSSASSRGSRRSPTS